MHNIINTQNAPIIKFYVCILRNPDPKYLLWWITPNVGPTGSVEPIGDFCNPNPADVSMDRIRIGYLAVYLRFFRIRFRFR